MKRIAGHILRALFITGMLICLGKAFSQYAELEHMGDMVHYLLMKPKTGAQLEALQKELQKDKSGRLSAAAWTLEKDVVFGEKEMGSNVKGSLILLKGESRLLYSSSENLNADDAEGCLLTENAAYALFGDTNVTGRSILYEAENRAYTIRGLIPGEEKLFVIQAPSEKAAVSDGAQSASKDIAFDQLAVLVYETGEMDRLDAVREFEGKAGITENDKKSDFTYYKKGGAFLISILPAMVFLLILLRGFGAVCRKSRKPFYVAGYLLVLLGIAVLFHFGSSAHFTIPESWIPAQWSDFSFWGEKMSESIRTFQDALFMQKGLVEIEYYNKMLSILLYVAAAVIFWSGSAMNLKFESEGEWYLFEVIALTITAGVLFWLKIQELILPAGWVWMALYPAYFLALRVFSGAEQRA